MTSALLALICVIVAGFVLRAPIGFSMIVSGIAYLAVKGQDVGLVAEQILNGLYNSYVLLAVPLFILAANLMNFSKKKKVYLLFNANNLGLNEMKGVEYLINPSSDKDLENVGSDIRTISAINLHRKNLLFPRSLYNKFF